MDEDQRHDFKNHLGIVLGFTELILEDTPESDPRHADLLEVRRAAQACLALLDGQPLAAPVHVALPAAETSHLPAIVKDA